LDSLIQDRVDARTNGVNPAGRTRLRILFAVASWGLGHATRDLPLIQHMLEQGHDVTIVSTDRALALLKHELGSRCTFLEWPDLPLSLAKSAPLFYAKFTLSLPLALRAIVAEHRALDVLLTSRRFDRVVSDSRFGIRTDRVASFQFSHGLRFIAPRRNRLIELAMEYIYYRCYGRSSRFVVPDFGSNGLSGELSHDLRFVRASRISYVGILSGIGRESVVEDIDYYISISGPEPQRTILEEIALGQVADLPGRVVMSLGKPEEVGRHWTHGSAKVYSYVSRKQQQGLMNRARLIVSRSGYTTMMELAELGKRALLIPTPGQTEQEYLADLHYRAGHYYAVQQSKLELVRDVTRAQTYPGYQPAHRTAVSIERFMEIVTS
jgi:UDP-N-acetylglucosamine transferase subunit ALG13